MSTTLENFIKYLDELQQYFHVNTLLYWDMRNTAPKLGLLANGEAIVTVTDGVGASASCKVIVGELIESETQL